MKEEAFVRKIHRANDHYERDTEYFVPLKPTGRWELRTSPEEENAMYIEHNGWPGTIMIHEDRITFRRATERHKFGEWNIKPNPEKTSTKMGDRIANAIGLTLAAVFLIGVAIIFW